MAYIIIKLLKRLIKKRQAPFSPPSTIIPREQHTLSRSDISDNALKVLKRLNKAGYQAFMVGGGVRDLLLRVAPKDFDVATNATPDEVKKLFRNCRLIGRRFRLAHVHFGRDIIEVATFRSLDSGKIKSNDTGMVLRDNQYGTLGEDAFRRDFTVNALYYNIDDFSVVDYHNGLSDLDDKLIRIIGDASERYEEDPVRILRAIRFAAKLDFTIEPGTAAPIADKAVLLQDVSSSRLFEEFIKLFHGGHALRTFKLLQQYDVLRYLLPQVHDILQSIDSAERMIQYCLESTDQRVNQNKPITPAFLYAAFLWPLVNQLSQQYLSDGMNPHQAMEAAAREVIAGQSKFTAIPKRLVLVVKEIWHTQNRLAKRSSERSPRLLHLPRFRAAYDFMVIRAKAGEVDQELADWWTTFQVADESEQAEMLKPFKQKRRRRRPKKKPSE